MDGVSAKPRYQPEFRPLCIRPPVRRQINDAPMNVKEPKVNAAAEKQLTGKSVAQQVLEIVQKYSGIGHKAIENILSSAKASTIRVALHDLEKRGKIERRTVDGAVRCYPAGEQKAEKNEAADSPQPQPPAPEDKFAARLAALEGSATERGTEKPTQRFRVARTSDRTIMLFGLTEHPLELTEEQSRILIDFVADEG